MSIQIGIIGRCDDTRCFHRTLLMSFISHSPVGVNNSPEVTGHILKPSPQLKAVYKLTGMSCEITLSGHCIVYTDELHKAIKDILDGKFGKTWVVALIHGDIDRQLESVDRLVQCCSDNTMKLYRAWEIAMYTRLYGSMIKSWYTPHIYQKYKLLIKYATSQILEYHPNYYWFKEDFYAVPHINISTRFAVWEERKRIKFYEEDNK